MKEKLGELGTSLQTSAQNIHIPSVDEVKSAAGGLVDKVKTAAKEYSVDTQTKTWQPRTRGLATDGAELPWDTVDIRLAPYLKSMENVSLQGEAKLRILQISEDPEVLTTPAPPDFKFDLAANAKTAQALLQVDPRLSAARFQLVPKRLREDEFWVHYFWRVSVALDQLEEDLKDGRLTQEVLRMSRKGGNNSSSSSSSSSSSTQQQQKGKGKLVSEEDEDIMNQLQEALSDGREPAGGGGSPSPSPAKGEGKETEGISGKGEGSPEAALGKEDPAAPSPASAVVTSPTEAVPASPSKEEQTDPPKAAAATAPDVQSKKPPPPPPPPVAAASGNAKETEKKETDTAPPAQTEEKEDEKAPPSGQQEKEPKSVQELTFEDIEKDFEDIDGADFLADADGGAVGPDDLDDFEDDWFGEKTSDSTTQMLSLLK